MLCHSKKRKNQGRQRGIAIVATAAWITVAIPFIGLGIDTGILWGAKARIASACAAASMAAARNLANGDQLDQQMANATQRGRAFFRANFPPGSYGIGEVKPAIQIVQTQASLLQVSATASANVPLYFLRYLGPTFAQANATGRATRRDVNLVLVLNSVPGNSCEELKQAAKTLALKLMGGRDRVGVVTSNPSAAVAYALNKNFTQDQELQTNIAGLTCEGSASIAESHQLASTQLLALNEPAALNLIVLFSTGDPAEFPANSGIVTYVNSSADIRQISARMAADIYHLSF